VVGVIAPSGVVDEGRLQAGIKVLEGWGLRVEVGSAVLAREAYLAGSDTARLADLQAMLDDDRVRAIFCARGGYGTMRLLPRLDLGPLVRDPRPFIGFSDVTALHAALLLQGVVGIHGPVVTQLGKVEEEDVTALYRLLEDPTPPEPWRGLTTLAAPSGRSVATGPLVGGNLELVTRLLGTPYLPPLDGAVLALEEIGERPYRLDRSLTQLELAGVWERVAAVVVGDLIGCAPVGGDGPAPEEVVRERLERLPVPVLAQAPFGHGGRNRAFAHGAEVRVDAIAGSLTFLEGAVV
jgi:muramoyltetrapeptide carboxypeptidase